MGWAAATNSIDAAGIALFLILMVWQIPHFIAIALFYMKDYEAAGIRTVPIVRGEFIAKWETVLYSTLLLMVSLVLVPLGVAGPIYCGIALTIGVVLIGISLRGLWNKKPLAWARQYFFATLIYLPVLTLGLILDKVLF